MSESANKKTNNNVKKTVKSSVTKPESAKTTIKASASKPESAKTTIKASASKPESAKTTTKSITKKPDSNPAKKATTAKKVIKPTIFASTKLPKEIFDIKVNKQAIFDTIMSDRSHLRQGTHKVKSRAEVSGSGIKPWKQKGTGRARASTRRSPIWVGGGRAFGPSSNRNYSLSVNKKVKKIALASALTLKAKENSVFINEFKLDKISTKEMVKLISLIDVKKGQRKVLIVTEDEKIFKSSANITNVNTIKINSLSVESVINADVIVLSSMHIKKLLEVIK